MVLDALQVKDVDEDEIDAELAEELGEEEDDEDNDDEEEEVSLSITKLLASPTLKGHGNCLS